MSGGSLGKVGSIVWWKAAAGRMDGADDGLRFKLTGPAPRLYIETVAKPRLPAAWSDRRLLRR